METHQLENAQDTIKALNTFLRGEISAVETYRLALDTLTDPTVRKALEFYMRSHVHRVELLRKQIADLGGEADSDSGGWGAFANTVEMGATLVSDTAAIKVLEEGEDHGLKLYREQLKNVTVPQARHLVSTELLPAQEKTHAYMSQLKKVIAH